MTKIDTRLAGTSRGERAAYQTVRFLVVSFCRIWCRMRVQGRDNLPASGPFILAPTHRSIIDTPVASGASRQRMRFMGADKWWKQKQFGQLLSVLGGFPVTRGSADREALKRCIDILAGGEPLVLFPEGERKSGPTVQPLFEGAAYIATKANVPVVPVAIAGSERAMPKGAKFIYPRKIVMIIGTPLHPVAGTTGKQAREHMAHLTADLHSSLQALLDEANTRVERPIG
jgi:1-acyl-sn-glycerol-3-phosphate acyltransferase